MKSSIAVLVFLFSVLSMTGQPTYNSNKIKQVSKKVEMSITQIGEANGFDKKKIALVIEDIKNSGLISVIDFALSGQKDHIASIFPGIIRHEQMSSGLTSKTGVRGGSATQTAVRGQMQDRNMRNSSNFTGITSEEKSKKFNERINHYYKNISGKGSGPQYQGGQHEDGEAAAQLGAMLWATILAYVDVYVNDNNDDSSLNDNKTINPINETPSGNYTEDDVEDVERRKGNNITYTGDEPNSSGAGGMVQSRNSTVGLYTDIENNYSPSLLQALETIRVLKEKLVQ